MKTAARFSMTAVLAFALMAMIFGSIGCASSRHQQSSDKQTMYDFVGGAKPEFNGKKY